MSIRVDSHQHFWRIDRGDYGWLTPELEPLYRDYSPDELLPLLERAKVQKTVIVQAAPTVDETRYLLSLAADNDFVAGVVGWVNMENQRESLDQLATFSNDKKFLGIRPMIQETADVDWMLRPELEASFKKLIDLDLRFDALVKPVHLQNLRELLQRHPDLNVVIDHGAKPCIGSSEWEPWASGIAAIAAQTNAYCKLSGLITETSAEQSYDDVWRYCEHLLHHFGPDRLMWGSDWPVLNLRGNYIDWQTKFDHWLSPLFDSERKAILGGTALDFYALDLNL